MTTNDQLPDPQSLGYEEARDELFSDSGRRAGASFWTRDAPDPRSALIYIL